jgi:hypothetical protein
MYGSVWAPEDAAAGKAQLTVSFNGPKAWGVVPAVLEIPLLRKPAPKTR